MWNPSFNDNCIEMNCISIIILRVIYNDYQNNMKYVIHLLKIDEKDELHINHYFECHIY